VTASNESVHISKENIRDQLPDGWKWVRLNDVCEQDKHIIEPESTEASRLLYLSLEHIESNSGRIFRVPMEPFVDEGKSTTYAFNKRHILYGKLRPYLNKVALPDFEGRCTTELIPLITKNNAVREYVAWILRRKETVQYAMREKTGSRMPRANIDDLFTLRFPLPPLPEQKRIATILNEQMTSVEKAHAAAEKQLEAAKALPAAYLWRLFPKQGQELPEGWKWVQLGNLCDFKRGPFGGSLKKEIFVKDGYKVYEQQHAIRNNFEIGNYYIDGNKYLEMEAFSIKPSDLIISCSGTMGRVAIVPSGVKPGIINQALLKLSPDLNQLEPAYLKDYLHTQSVQTQYFQMTAGSAIKNVASVSVLKGIPIPLPPFSEQKRISAELSEQLANVERVQEKLEAQLDEINALPAALLRKAFNGDL
jgi:type I restriction enzyme S subunit